MVKQAPGSRKREVWAERTSALARAAARWRAELQGEREADTHGGH